MERNIAFFRDTELNLALGTDVSALTRLWCLKQHTASGFEQQWVQQYQFQLIPMSANMTYFFKYFQNLKNTVPPITENIRAN